MIPVKNDKHNQNKTLRKVFVNYKFIRKINSVHKL